MGYPQPRLATLLLALFTLSLGAACDHEADPVGGDIGPSLDQATVTDVSGLPDGLSLYKCKDPGMTCNAHDPCAINPICGKDGVCRPESLMNCDDELACTTDICVSIGVCKNLPKAGTCKIGVRVPVGTKCSGIKLDAGAGAIPDSGPDAGVAMETISCCVTSGTKNPADPCQTCAPSTDDAGVSSNNTKWSSATGGACDDGNLCTKDDACLAGICTGTSFATLCSDGYSCTTDLCDGKGACLGNSLKAGFCLINGACYKDGINNPSGACGTCDATKSTSAWTSITNACLIAGKCYSKGQKNSTGCGACDPSMSTSAWSAVPNTCLIGGKCYQPKAKHTGGCAECDPLASGTAWTVKGTTHCLIQDKCLAAGAKHPGGCHKCDPTQSKIAWTSLGGACGKCLPFNDTTGKPCTTANATTVCASSGLCLLTGTTGVCTQYCTADNPTTTINEDTCPNQPANTCAGVPLSDGTTKYFCMHLCDPYIGCNECDSTLVCHPQSGSLIGMSGAGVCLLTKAGSGCAKNSDCAITSGQVCDVVKGGCPSGQTCQARSQDTSWSAVGMCVKDGACDTVSGLCKAQTTGKATAKVGDPCKGDVECAAGQSCLLEFDEKTLRKPGGYSCTSGGECCSGTCTNKSCVGGNCNLLWRNGYCAVSNCAFSKTLTGAACPTGTLCNLGYRTGLCQPTCSLSKASDCRGQAKDIYGDYECRDWSQVTYSHGKATSGPVCDLGPLMPCSSTSATGTIKKCEVFGDATNSTNMTCRNLKGVKLANPTHAKGYCLDKTASGPVPGIQDGGASPKDSGPAAD